MKRAFAQKLVTAAACAAALGTLGCLPELGADDEILARDESLTAEDEELAALASGLAAGLDCPAASESAPLSLFWWRTVRKLDRYVWSSDGSEVAGLEVTYEEKKHWWPFYSETEKRRFCHRLFVQQPDGSGRSFVGGLAPLATSELYDMKPAGYFVVESFDANGNLLVHRWSRTGTRQLIAQTPDSCSWKRVIPSPDGARLASLLVQMPCNANGDPAAPATVTVEMLDAAGVAVGPQDTVGLTGWVVPVWSPQGTFVTTDATSAFAFGADGEAPVAVARPTCLDPATTSSKVDAQGRMLDLVNGQIGVATVAPDRAFGCGL